MRRVLIIRYGGFGDALQAASILPSLKSQGWHVTWDASEMGFELLKSDPLIDAMLLTPAGSVPLDRTGEYWNARANGFTRVINLCESVECALLMLPKALGFFHDDDTRRRLYGSSSYVYRIHAIAGTDGPYVPRYCPTAEEMVEASATVQEAHSCVVALAGSAEYKVWPHAAQFVGQVLAQTDARIFLAGGSKDAPLAEGILAFVSDILPDQLYRVVNMVDWPVRRALAVGCAADCVIGPETGMLNAVAGFPNRKVVMLSHSSPANLTLLWTNTIAMVPDVPCHPCHRLHQTTKFCPRGPSGEFAACAESIHPDAVLAACISEMRKR